MTDALSRAFAADIQVRADGEGRTISGIVVPFGQVARVSDGGLFYDEAFQQGAFRQALNHMGGNYGRVKLLSQHQQRSNPLGKATLLREDAAGLYGEFHVSKTRAGDEAIELVRDGAIDSFSIGFRGIKAIQRDRVTWRTEAGINEASLVTFPSYAGASVHGVRDEWDGLTDEMREQAMAWLRNQNPPAEPGTGTSPEGAPVDEAAPGPLRSNTQQQKLAYLAGLIERGLK